jgi:O-methyltransferase
MNITQKLRSIIEKYGSDKALSGYTNLYGKLFSKYISKNINYLEIGLGTLDPSIPSTFVGNPSHYPHYKPAGVLRAWKEYFENAHIYGIDVAEDCMISDDRITTHLLDSTDIHSCTEFLPNISFDIILDDGLHTSDAQIKTFRNFFNRLREGGLYIIEDIGGGGDGRNVWTEHGPEISESIRNHEYFYGGNVLIIRKNNSAQGELSFDQFNHEEASILPTSSDRNLTIVSETLSKVLQFQHKNIQICSDIINLEQISNIVSSLIECIDTNVEGDVVEFGCFVGESSKYIRHTLDVCESTKELYVYDSFEGLPDLSKWEEGTGWKPRTLKTSKDILFQNFETNGLKPPIAHKDWFKDVPDEHLPEKISFAFLDGDFYDSIYDSLSKIYDRVVPGGYILFHDYDRHDLPGVKAAVFQFLEERGINPCVDVLCEQLGRFQKPQTQEITSPSQTLPQPGPKNLTIVSGLWDIAREGRDWSQYEEHFDKFLKIPCNMVLWVPKSLESFIWERRSKENTLVKIYELDDIKNIMFKPFWDNWQSIRTNPEWQNQAGWLSSSPQCKNEYYNPIVMSKMFFLHDSKIWNHFDTDYFIWLDAGISQTCYENYFYDKKILESITDYLDPFLFLSYPYEADKEIHGFEFNAINRYAGEKVDYVCRGGLFGGHKDFISHANSEYYHLLNQSLKEGLAGTEESIFSIMSKLSPENYKRYSLDSNGLVVKFTQALQDGPVKLEECVAKKPKFTSLTHDISKVKTNLYFLTFNFPEQLETTIKSLQKHEGFLSHPTQKILIDNSTNDEAREGNRIICEEYGFEHIIMNKNTGICGGRQFAAEHFDGSDSDFYLFFEDDMTISDPEEGTCRNGFQKYVPDLYKKLHQIMIKEKFDFLKLSYTEVYMDNNIQVSWYNVPQAVRNENWPEYNKLPTTGLDPNCPRTKFKTVEVLNGLSYASGEIYYANWPQIVSKEGNKKMFIDTTWAHPFEQTWMSHIFQETRNGNINPAVLLASTVTHDRFKHYQPEDRVES